MLVRGVDEEDRSVGCVAEAERVVVMIEGEGGGAELKRGGKRAPNWLGRSVGTSVQAWELLSRPRLSRMANWRVPGRCWGASQDLLVILMWFGRSIHRKESAQQG